MRNISKKAPIDTLTLKQAGHYDKIIKENIAAVIPGLLVKVLHIEAVEIVDIKQDIQHTKERKPDLLQIITDSKGYRYVLHIEFQVKDDTEVPYRMLEYKSMLLRKFKLPVKQFVIYLGEGISKVPPLLTDDNLWYAYKIAPISMVDYHEFINSDNPEEIIFAILGNFGGEQAETVVAEIIDHLGEKADGLALQKFVTQLRILSNLRKLQPTVDIIMEHLSTYFEIEKDWFYIKGQRDAEQKLREKELKIEQKLREKEQKLREKEQKIIAKLILNTDLTDELIANITTCTLEVVKNLREKLNKK